MINAIISTYTPIGKQALFAVKISDDSGNSHERVVPLTSKNSYTAQLLAVKYVCEAVENKDVAIEITTSMPYIMSTLNRDQGGHWKKTRTRGSNSALVDELKKLLGAFKSFSLNMSTTKVVKLKDAIKEYSSI